MFHSHQNGRILSRAEFLHLPREPVGAAGAQPLSGLTLLAAFHGTVLCPPSCGLGHSLQTHQGTDSQRLLYRGIQAGVSVLAGDGQIPDPSLHPSMITGGSDKRAPVIGCLNPYVVLALAR
ncbi:unnamed protein product [Lepidochelys olivacea]